MHTTTQQQHEPLPLTLRAIRIYLPTYSSVENRKSHFGFYVVSTITGQKHYRECVESHKISCAEKIVSC